MIRWICAAVALINVACAVRFIIGDGEISPLLAALDKMTLAGLFAVFAARGRI